MSRDHNRRSYNWHMSCREGRQLHKVQVPDMKSPPPPEDVPTTNRKTNSNSNHRWEYDRFDREQADMPDRLQENKPL